MRESRCVSLRNTARAFPTLLRVGFADAVAYRAEMLVWVLATTMPLVMLALWTTVARRGADRPLRRSRSSSPYFLATFIVRQLTGSWVFYEMNFDGPQRHARDAPAAPRASALGVCSRSLAAMPMRLVVSLPVAIVALAVVGSHGLTHDPILWASGLASSSAPGSSRSS